MKTVLSISDSRNPSVLLFLIRTNGGFEVNAIDAGIGSANKLGAFERLGLEPAAVAGLFSPIRTVTAKAFPESPAIRETRRTLVQARKCIALNEKFLDQATEAPRTYVRGIRSLQAWERLSPERGFAIPPRTYVRGFPRRGLKRYNSMTPAHEKSTRMEARREASEIRTSPGSGLVKPRSGITKPGRK